MIITVQNPNETRLGNLSPGDFFKVLADGTVGFISTTQASTAVNLTVGGTQDLGSLGADTIVEKLGPGSVITLSL